MVASGWPFDPKFWKSGRDPGMVLYHSVNSGYVVGALKPYPL